MEWGKMCQDIIVSNIIDTMKAKFCTDEEF